jgi:hypothetical protein
MVTKKQIQKVLSEVSFTPSKDKMMQIVMDSGNDDYYLRRAKELLTQLINNHFPPFKSDAIIMIMRLLALVQVNQNER